MRGTVIKYTPKTGKPTFGYYFVAGRDENGKRIQIMKRGFARRSEAEQALKKAIEEQEKAPVAGRKLPTFVRILRTLGQGMLLTGVCPENGGALSRARPIRHQALR